MYIKTYSQNNDINFRWKIHKNMNKILACDRHKIDYHKNSAIASEDLRNSETQFLIIIPIAFTNGFELPFSASENRDSEVKNWQYAIE